MNSNCSGIPVGYAKNRAVEVSTGDYLCFQDIVSKNIQIVDMMSMTMIQTK